MGTLLPGGLTLPRRLRDGLNNSSIGLSGIPPQYAVFMYFLAYITTRAGQRGWGFLARAQALSRKNASPSILMNRDFEFSTRLRSSTSSSAVSCVLRFSLYLVARC